MKSKALKELDILRCGYSRRHVHSIFFIIGKPYVGYTSWKSVLLFLLNFP